MKDRKSSPSCRFRSRLRDLLLDTRIAIHQSQFDDFLSWMNHQMEVQIEGISQVPIGYDELAGIYTKAPVASLESELLWITARIKANAALYKDFRLKAEELERLVFTGKFNAAIEALKHIELVFGVSLWSVQLRIALEHQAGGLEQQKRYTAEVRGIYKNGLLRFVAYHTSVRNEDRSTLAKFCDDIKVRIDRHQYYDPSVKTYARYRLAGEWSVSESGLADILRVEQSHSSIDVYETFVAVAQEISRRDNLHKAHKVLAKCLHDLTHITDFRLAKIARVLGGSDFPVKFSPRRTEISDALFIGNARLAAQIARRTLRAPYGIDLWQFIYAGLAFAHTTRPREREFHRPNDISWLISRVLCRCDISDDSFGLLGKLAINLYGLPTAAGLTDLLPLLRRSRPDDPWQPWLISMNSPTIGVEDLVPNTTLSNLTIQTESCSVSPTGSAWQSFQHVEYVSTNVSQTAPILFTVACLLREGQYQQVVDIIGTQNPNLESEPLRSIASSMLLHAYFCLGDRQNVITLIAHEGACSESNCRLLPILPTFEHYTWSDYKAVSTPLATPIALHLLWSKNEDNEIASRLRFATGAVFKTHGVTRPSELVDLADGFQKQQLIYFLRDVCVPNILDSCRILKSSREVMEERQAVCAALRDIDPINSDAYQNEVIWISNQLALDEGQRIIDRTRIYVDTEALSRWATRELSEDYARYRDLLEVNVGTIQNFDDVLKEIAMAASSQRSTFTPENEADAVLVSMLHRLSEEFLNNPSFGFDFYLSKRVRHQSFTGLIRSPLETTHIITTRESESGSYHRNEFWLEKLVCSNSEAKEALNDAFSKFAANFDDTLTNAKNSFHVNSLERPSGLLNLELTPQLISIVRAIDQIDTTLPDFIDTAIAVIWAAIEPSLNKVRCFISDDLKTKITEGFDELRATVRRHVEQDSASLEFDIQIGNCSTEVQHKLDDAAKWFLHADLEAQKRLFKLEQIVNIAIDSALKCQRAFEPDIEPPYVDGDLEMQASSLVFVHDVLFIALDNVRAHSGLKKPKVKVNVQANIENGTLTIKVLSDSKVQNRAMHDEELRRIQKLIDIGNFGRHTRREGGSGFLKLAAVVLRQSSKGQIDFGFTDTGQFQLSVVYSMIVQTPD
ncbi:hypothetical protein [Methylobacter sp.]|uniref:hypothetical protein n=1 Tax=Methylobacter sp. TaxID=2051955 RepID=UPI00122C1145|nr:hypothetical protein [Methylobacter sp.]TAK61934.1 MAG: hypothetical protein EPO18_12150 [Methylobacter sp.]